MTFLALSFFLYYCCFGTDCERCFAYVPSAVVVDMCFQDWTYFIGHSGKFFVSLFNSLKFHGCEHNMSWALERNNNRGIKPESEMLLFNHYKHFISTTIMPIATKLDRVVTALKGLLFIMSHGSLITRSCQIT